MRRAPVASALLVLLLVAACGGSTPSGDSGSSAASPPVAPGTSVDTGSGASSSAEPPASSTPSDTPGPSASDTTPPGPADSGAPSDSPSSTAGGAAAACTGSPGNQAFYANLAASVSWDVYCAVLPKGWVVASGSYRLANGGKLDISYRGPDGATLTLSEGSFCTDGTGCVPPGGDGGAASFGQLPGSLVTTDAGGFAIVAGRGQLPSWLMVTSGLDQATTVALGAALAKVGS
jgi:hypothetical protein